MIAPIFTLAILLVARVAADVSAPVEVSQAQPVPVHHLVSNQPESHHPIVSGSQVAQEHQHQHQHQPQLVHHQHLHQPQHQQAQYYSAPSGLIQPMGVEHHYGSGNVLKQYSANGAPVVVGGSSAANEQYGQPESGSLPANYKPFGSWGLYIGGNPADGYYSSYYKALGQSVADKQQQVTSGDSVKPQVAAVSQASGFSGSGAQPLLKQAFQMGQDQGYPYESSSSYYSPADLNSGSRVSVVPQSNGQFAPAVYNYVEQPSVSGLSYAPSAFSGPEQYAPGTKRSSLSSSSSSSSSSYATKSRDVQVPQTPAKGYQQQQQQGYYSYAGVPSFAYQSPVESHHQYYQQQQQVVAYPVPVGSQIVGSQPGVEGAYSPFGVHGFTRYAIKPTVVGLGAVHSVTPVSQFPVYKQAVGYQQPLGFYGYPLSQLHYSHGSSQMFGHQQQQPHQGSSNSHVESSSVGQQPHQLGGEQSAPAPHIPYAYPIEGASSEKSESSVENKPVAAAAAAAAASAPVQPAISKPVTTTTTTTTK